MKNSIAESSDTMPTVCDVILAYWTGLLVDLTNMSDQSFIIFYGRRVVTTASYKTTLELDTRSLGALACH